MLLGFFNIAVLFLIVVLSIWVHYECLNQLNRMMIRIQARPRVRIIGGVAVAIIAHIIEVGIFALGYVVLAEALGLGSLVGALDSSLQGDFSDYLYFSFVTYTTVGFGDIMPLGPLRWLAGIESLTGFVLITWTASFLYLEMSRFWSNR